MSLIQSNKSGTLKVTKPTSPLPITSIHQITENASNWPIIDGVPQKNGFAYCSGGTLDNTSGKYDNFNTANGSLVLPNGPYRTSDIPISPTTSIGSFGLSGFATFFSDEKNNWYMKFNCRGTDNAQPNIDLCKVTIPGVSIDDKETPTIYFQSTSNVPVFSLAGALTGGIQIITDGTTGRYLRLSGVVKLNSKPTITNFDSYLESYPVISLYDNIAAGALGLPEATADVSGIVTRNQVTEAGRNYIINGGFEINQRGDKTVADAVSGYVQDRWVMAASGANYTSQVLDLGDNSEFSKYLRMEATTANDNWGFYQRIENVRTLAGKEATLSFYARSDNSSITNVNLVYSQIFGTGGTPSAIKTVFLPQISLTSSWQKFELTFNVDEIASKTIGTDGNDYLEIGFIQADGVVTGRFDFREIKLEEGTVATKFTRAGGTYAGELALCQRYYETGYTGFYGASGSRIGGSCQYAVKKRKATTFTSQVNIAGAGVTSISVNTSQDLGSFYWISNAGLTIGTSTQHTFTWQADAEL